MIRITSTIAAKMKKEGLDQNFVDQISDLSYYYDGFYDLMFLWYMEETEEEKNNLIETLEYELNQKLSSVKDVC